MKRLFALFPAVWGDARAIIARRWWVGVLCTAALAWAKDWTASAPTDSVRRLISTMMLLATALVVWFVAYAETRRREDPSFSLTGEKATRLIGQVFGYGLVETILAIPGFFVLVGLHQAQLAALWFVLVDAAMRAKFGFVFFAPAVEDQIGYSWSLSSGPALVSSLALGAIFTLSMQIPNDALAWVSVPSIGGAFARGSLPLVDILALAFVFPWMLRWMRVAESLQPVPEETAPT